MKFLKSMLFTLALIVLQLNLNAQTGVTPLYNGAYMHVLNDSTFKFIRFFEDQTVIQRGVDLHDGLEIDSFGVYMNKNNFSSSEFSKKNDELRFGKENISFVTNYEAKFISLTEVLLQRYSSNYKLLSEENYKFKKLENIDQNLNWDDSNVYKILAVMPNIFESRNRKDLDGYLTRIVNTAKTNLNIEEFHRSIITFIVNKDGSLTNFEIRKTNNDAISKEIIKILEKEIWLPGEYDNTIVKVKEVGVFRG